MSEEITGCAKAPGTCGELVEGTIEGKDFLITCPIDIWSEITVWVYGNKNEACDLYKSKRAIELAVSKWSQGDISFSFNRVSSLPAGKGMGSSTADIAAAAAAVARALGKEATPDDLADIALAIEPSDALMYPGIYLFDHKRGSWRVYLGEPPDIDIVVLDPGGEVDTLQFNSRRNLAQLNSKKEPQVKEAVRLVVRGIREKDPEKIGRGATISARANQEILPKDELEEVIRLAQTFGAVGVNIAHSGTVMGILLSPERSDAEEVADYFKRKKQWNIFITRLIGGGIR